MSIHANARGKLKELYSRQNPNPKTPCGEGKQLPNDSPCPSDENRLTRLEETSGKILNSILAHEEYLARIQEHLARIEEKQAEFVEAVVDDDGREQRSFYTPAEFAAKLVQDGVKKHLTARRVQTWCRDDRINAEKRSSGRGTDGEWKIPASEYDRYINEGLLPASED